MVTIARKARQIQFLQASFLALLGDAIKERQYEYISLLRGNLIIGFAKNRRIGIYKSRRYAQMKYKISQRAGFGNVDLRLTGAFYEGLRLTIMRDRFIVESSDKKSNILEERYGKDIFILSAEAHSKFIRNVFHVFKDKAITSTNRIE